MSLVILVADGARPDALAQAMDDGHLPALAQLRAEGGYHTISSVFPTVTGPAYTPFLMGLHPGRAGVPGIRWWDRAREAGSWPDYARSYVGIEARHADADLTRAHQTLFEYAEHPLGAFTPIGRGLRGSQRIGFSWSFGLRMGWTHFRGDVPGWLKIDRELGLSVAARVRTDRPDLVFLAHPGIDKVSHQLGHQAPAVLEAMRTVDRTAAMIREDAERDGRWESMQLWVVSDHGHSPVGHHEDLAGLLSAWGLGVIAHPWVYGRGRDAAVMVSGNAMAHIYFELDRRERPWWPALAGRWSGLVDQLMARDSVDLAILPQGAHRAEVRAHGRGTAMVWADADGCLSYQPESGDPLGLEGPVDRVSADESWERCAQTDYPDALVQILAIGGASRSGDLLLSATRDWDFRSRYEPIPHRSAHGALHREHMLVPLLLSRPATGTPRRTVDVFPSALTAMGRAIPAGLDGRSFL